MEEIEENISNDSIAVPNTTFDRNANLAYTISSLSDADYFCNLFNHNNGYGIVLIADSGIVHGKIWEDSYTGVPYINSLLHTQYFVDLSNNLKAVLGNHLVNRSVLLGSSIGFYTNNYTWTTSYCNLLSEYQIKGGYGILSDSRYDTGEATYMFPYCAFTDINSVLYNIIANNNLNKICPYKSFQKTDNRYICWGINYRGALTTISVDDESYFSPVIYIR